jgi:hypothetical protein
MGVAETVSQGRYRQAEFTPFANSPRRRPSAASHAPTLDRLRDCSSIGVFE